MKVMNKKKFLFWICFIFGLGLFSRTVSAEIEWDVREEVKNKEIFKEIGNKVYFIKEKRPQNEKIADARVWGIKRLISLGEIPNPKGIYIYDKKTGNIKEFLKGKFRYFSYYNKRFYLQEGKTVFSVNMKGKDKKVLVKNGVLKGVINGKILIHLYKNNKVVASLIYQNGKLIKKIKNKEINYISNNYGVYSMFLGQTSLKITSLKGNNTINFGNPFKESYEWIEVMEMKEKKNLLYIAGILTSGADVYNGDFVLLEVNVKNKKECKLIDRKEEGIYSIIFDSKGKASLSRHKSYYAYEKNGGIYYDSAKGERFKITNNYLKLLNLTEPEYDEFYIISHMKTVSNDIYLIVEKYQSEDGKENSELYLKDRYYAKIPVKNPKKAKIIIKDSLPWRFTNTKPSGPSWVLGDNVDRSYNLVLQRGYDTKILVENAYGFESYEDGNFIYYTLQDNGKYQVYRMDKKTFESKFIIKGEGLQVVSSTKKYLYICNVNDIGYSDKKLIYDKKSNKVIKQIEWTGRGPLVYEKEERLVFGGLTEFANSRYKICTLNGKKVFEIVCASCFVRNKKFYYLVMNENVPYDHKDFIRSYISDLNGKNVKRITNKEFEEAQKR